MNDRILKRVTVIKDKNIVDISNMKNEKNFYQKSASSSSSSRLMNGGENSIKYGTSSNRLHSMRMAKTTTTATMMTNMKNSILSRSQELITNKNNKLHLATTPPSTMMMLKNVYESINANGVVVDSAVDDGGVNENVIEFNNTNIKRDCANDGYTLGISIVQGTDNNVYVKDMVANGPGDRSGIIIGDQVSGIVFLWICIDLCLKKNT
jgi:hypothetical protein